MDIIINWWAVLAGGVLSMILGMIWYNPKVFGTMWMTSQGKNMEEAMNKMNAMKAEGKSSGMGKSYVINFIGALLMAYVMSNVVGLAGVFGFGEGVRLGFMLWLGLVATAMLGMVLWEGKPWKYYMIVSGYHLVNMILVAGLIAAWS